MEWQLLPITDFSDLAATWDELNCSSHSSILLRSDLIGLLLKYFSTGRELLAIQGDVTSPGAMAIVGKTGFGRWQTFQPSQSPLGCWLQRQELNTEQLCKNLSAKLPGPVLIFSVTQQDPDLLNRPHTSSHLSTLDYIETARVTVNSDFDTYWSKRGKNLRQGLRRQRNRLERENTSTKLVEITDPKKVEAAIEAYGKLESAGWKSETGTAIEISNVQGQFYNALLQNYCNKGMGTIYQYWYNEELAATDLCIHDQDNIVILKTTYDSEITTSSPAMLMRQEAFEKIFEQQLFKHIEFYGKVMDWHRKWSDEIRIMYHINYLPLKLFKFIKEFKV